MDANQEAKHRFITVFFDDAEERIVILDELAGTGYEREALTLCLTYIDSFAQWLCWPLSSTGHNFVKAVIQFGGDTLMGLVHPSQAICVFSQMKSPWKTLAERIAHAFPGPVCELLPVSHFEQVLGLTPTERAEVWRATIANIVYQHLRNPSVHGFRGSGGIILSQTTYQGQPVPIIGFPQLKSCAWGLVAEARRRSEANGEWFGNDATVQGT